MKNFMLFVLAIAAFSMASVLSGCAGTPYNKVHTFKEAVDERPDLESGIYNRENGENVEVSVKSLKAEIADLEKQLHDSQKETRYYKGQNDELEHENMLLRAKGNYTMEHEKPEITGWDRQSNPIVRKVRVNPEPAKNPEPAAERYPATESEPQTSATPPVLQQPVVSQNLPEIGTSVKVNPPIAAPAPAPAAAQVAQAPAPSATPVESPKVADTVSSVGKGTLGKVNPAAAPIADSKPVIAAK